MLPVTLPLSRKRKRGRANVGSEAEGRGTKERRNNSMNDGDHRNACFLGGTD